MPFENTEQVNRLFIQGQQHIEKNLIKKKFLPTNAYYGRIETGQFPKNSGITQRGHRLGRQAYPEDAPWRKLDQDECDSNVGDFEPTVIPSNGSDTYYWYPVAMDLRTDWIRIDELILNQFPEQEIAHIEDSLQRINRQVNEEFTRTWYTNACEFKWAGILPKEITPNDNCEQIICDGSDAFDDMWVFETFPDGQPNPNIIRVRLPYDQLYRISALSLDSLEEAVIRLERDGDYISESVMMFDTVIPDVRVSRQLQRQDDILNNNYKSVGGFSAGDLDRSLGHERAINNFAIRRDPQAFRYKVAPIADQTAPGSFDSSDPSTWAKLVRVFPFTRIKAQMGVKHVTNKEYLRADFAITNLFQKRVGRIEDLPDTSGYGTARKESGYASEGYFHWRNPDWVDNVKRNKGFWMACYRKAWHPRETELGHSFLHRLDHRIGLSFVKNPLTTAKCVDPVTQYQCLGVGISGENGANVVQGTRQTYS